MKKMQESEKLGPGWIRPEEARRYAGVSRRTLSDWMSRRLVKFTKVSHRVVLFRKADIDAALERLATKSVDQ